MGRIAPTTNFICSLDHTGPAVDTEAYIVVPGGGFPCHITDTVSNYQMIIGILFHIYYHALSDYIAQFSNWFFNFSGTKGPVHTFNNYKANFYISTGNGGCSINGDAKTDADYFCRSFYGDSYNATSYKRGSYSESGRMDYQMHRGQACSSGGEDIYGTNNNIVQTISNGYGNRCKIWRTTQNYQGLYDIVCSNIPGIFTLMSSNGSLFLIILIDINRSM